MVFVPCSVTHYNIWCDWLVLLHSLLYDSPIAIVFPQHSQISGFVSRCCQHLQLANTMINVWYVGSYLIPVRHGCRSILIFTTDICCRIPQLWPILVARLTALPALGCKVPYKLGKMAVRILIDLHLSSYIHAACCLASVVVRYFAHFGTACASVCLFICLVLCACAGSWLPRPL